MFTGSGAAAIVLIDVVMFGTAFSVVKGLFIGLIIIGVIGIKMTTSEPKVAENEL